MKIITLCLPLTVLVLSCSNIKNESQTENISEGPNAVEKKQEVEAACIWENISVREKPDSKSKWLTSISLGESVTYLGEEGIDSLDKNRKYLKVRLADGTEGWSVADFIIPESEAGTFTEESDVYRRPDLLTKTDKKYSQMDIVAIKTAQDDWIEVVGKRSEGKWVESGWVKSNSVSLKDVDIAVAKFGNQALSKDSNQDKAEALKEIFNNTDLSGSVLIPQLESKLIELESSPDAPDNVVDDSAAVEGEGSI